MASAVATTGPGSAPGSPAPGQRWLYGPVTDLVLGCGGIYLLAVAVLYYTVVGRFAAEWGLVVGGLLALFVNGPHYGATLVRVYEQRDERRKYAFFAIHVTILLVVLLLVGLHVHWIGSVILTVYFTWTPWHFSGQNYGLALLFLRRRGIDVTPTAKRALYGCFVLSTAVTLISLHDASPQLGLAPVPSTDGSTFRFLSLGIPAFIRTPLLYGTFAAYLASTVLAAALLLRRARARDLVPSACLVLAQASWFAIPAMLQVGGASTRNVAFSTVWIALAHSIQYLWVTSYFAKQTGRESSFSAFFARCLVAGAIVIVVPALVLAPDLLGPLPYDAGLAILVFSIVNLHHFILDGAIWKLRDGRIARILIRREQEAGRTEGSPRPRLAFTIALFAVGIAALAVEVTGVLERDRVHRAAASDEVTQLARGTARLDRLGRESARLEAQLAGQILARGGSRDRARAHLERSLELQPSPDVWHALATLEAAEGSPRAAADAYAAALAIDPTRVESWRGAASAWAAAGDRQRALDALDRARALAPEQPADARLRRRLEGSADAS